VDLGRLVKRRLLLNLSSLSTSAPAPGVSTDLVIYEHGGGLQHIESQHPPNKEYCNNVARGSQQSENRWRLDRP